MNENNPNQNNTTNVCGQTPAKPQTPPAYQQNAPYPPAPSPFAPPPYMPKPKKTVATDIFDIIALVLTFGFSYVFFDQLIKFNFSTGLCIGYVLIFALASAYIISKQKKFPLSAIFPGAVALLTAFSYALHAEESFLGILMLIFISGVYCVELTGSNKHSSGSYFYFLDLLKCQVLVPVANWLVPVRSFSAKRTKTKKTNSKKITAIIIGFACAIPVLIIVIPLLLSDAAFDSVLGSAFGKVSELFSKLSDHFFNVTDAFNIIFAVVVTAIFAPYIYCVMFSFRHGLAKNDNKDTSENYTMRVVSTNILCGFLGVISVVYVIYLLSQTAYFFSAFAGHLPGGSTITVTEYARQGFFEMTKIAGINLCIIAACVLFGKRESGKISAVVKWFSLFLCVFNLVMVATSISKILLYINQMGLTEKRLYVFVFDVVLVFVFLSIIIRIFNEKFPYMRVILVAACVAVTALNIFSVNNIIVRVNTDMLIAGKIPESKVEEEDFYNSYHSHFAYTKTQFVAAQKLAKSDNEKLAEHGRAVLYATFNDTDYGNFTFDENGKVKNKSRYAYLDLTSYISYLERNYANLQEYINPDIQLKSEYPRHLSKYDGYCPSERADTMIDPKTVDEIFVSCGYSEVRYRSDYNGKTLYIADKDEIEKILTYYQSSIDAASEDEYSDLFYAVESNKVLITVDGIVYEYTFISDEMLAYWEGLINEQAS
ncbi:MAG: DUF4173 domain-containing protein [Faecalibacterium sp.]|nr:DUF4173 domain-containing protein [Ruminococcus sp.]MCM1392839.1 DUF4173 domain-containing protein [Ruminococcus sp.]MCM1486331.1 DUF4173 domain-containing protein [Faecalibacterium sp.]